jgi:glucokinase
MILAGDVGGTKVRLALFEEKGGMKFIHEQKFASREFADFSTLLKEFLAHEQLTKISAACFGIAGPVRDGICRATNLPWEVSARALEKDMKIPKVDLINDLEANAWGLRCLSPEEFYMVNAGGNLQANQALISAGTGLGEAGLYWDGKSHRPFACEGGHCDFAPTNELEGELLQYLKKQFTHVSYERILSGPGLYQLYRFLIDTKKEKEDPAVAAAMQQSEGPRLITEKGSSGESKACQRACQLFIEIYGSEAGNLALKLLAFGGIYIGGGIAPHLLPFFKEGGFMKKFADKGRLSTVLMEIPIRVVLNEKTALLGAARFAQENR